MTDIEAKFYRSRDQRIHEYVNNRVYWDAPVCIRISDEVCETPAGQVCLLSLVNQLARTHRTFHLGIPTRALTVVDTLFGERTLAKEVETTLLEINPFARVLFEEKSSELAIKVGIGDVANCDFYLGMLDDVAILERTPVTITSHSKLAALLAASFGSAAILRESLGMPWTPRRVSAWTFLPVRDPVSNWNEPKEVSVGNALVIGAGAVAAGAAYSLRVIGHRSEWTVVDKDFVELHNTSRGATFFAGDAGWPNGIARLKSDNISSWLGNATSVPAWYHESGIDASRFDLILCLANEHGVRSTVASLRSPVVLQATTGADWTAFAHRHIFGKDGCVHCRMKAFEKSSKLACSSVAVDPVEKHSDAAVPALSFTSGLMLAVLMKKLELGLLGVEERNEWGMYFNEFVKPSFSGRSSCDCDSAIDPKIVDQVYGKTKWAQVTLKNREHLSVK